MAAGRSGRRPGIIPAARNPFDLIIRLRAMRWGSIRIGFEVEWTCDIGNPASWQPMDVPGNRPFFLLRRDSQEAVMENTTSFGEIQVLSCSSL